MSEENLPRYSGKITYIVNNADPTKLGIRLAKACIAKNIPVTDVAEFFGVSRQSVYMWFKGKCNPRKEIAERVESLVEKLSSQ